MTERLLRVVTAGSVPAAFPRREFDGQVELTAAQTDDELRTLARAADILYSWQVPETIPAETPDLRWVQLPSAGADHLRHLPVWRSDVVITASKGIHSVPMSEHLFAMLLAITRQVAAIGRGQERREWLHGGRGSELRLTELRGKTMGILGWGKIGDGIAHLARAFGMRVVGTRWSVVVPREVPRGNSQPFSETPMLPPLYLPHDVVYPASQLHEVLAQSDIVVSLLPLTSETRGSIGEAEFRAMKRGALFFNLGRGPVVDEDALIRALQSGRLAGAGLDVFSHEPLPRSSPLWAMKNVIVSPHVGGNSDRTSDRAAHFFAVNLERYLKGQPLLNVVGRNTEY